MEIAKKQDGGKGQYTWPPPSPRATFKVLLDKLAEYRREGMSVHMQLAVIDYWVSRLFEVRANIGGGNVLQAQFRR